MSQKPASKQTRQILSENMGKTLSMYLPILNDCVYTYNSLVKISVDDIHTLKEKNIIVLWQNLIDLELIVAYSGLELATAIRADFRSTSFNEQRYNLKYISIVVSESYKYLLGFKGNQKNSVWGKIKKLSLQIDDEDFKKDCSKIESMLLEFGENETDKNLRDIATHYDDDPMNVYNTLMAISEDNETKRASNYLAIIQEIHIFINKYIQKYQIPLFIRDKSNIKLAFWDTIDSFPDENDKIYTTVSNAIPKYSHILDSIIQNFNLLNKVKEHFDLDESALISTTHVVSVSLPSIHFLYLYIDMACAIRAYLRSEYCIEKQLNIKRLNVIIYEGFKHLYGYTDTEYDNSFWNKYIAGEIMPSADVNSAELLQRIENVLKGLSKDKTINNPNLRNLSIHYRDKKQNNIPIIYEELIKLNPILEMNNSLKLLKVLPLMFDMLQRAIQTAYDPVLK